MQRRTHAPALRTHPRETPSWVCGAGGGSALLLQERAGGSQATAQAHGWACPRAKHTGPEVGRKGLQVWRVCWCEQWYPGRLTTTRR